MSIRLEIFDDDKWPSGVGDRWLAYLEGHPTARICLPTGDTPTPVYEWVAGEGDFSHTTMFVLDEFALPPGNPARCDEMIHRDFLDLLLHQPAAMHRLDSDVPDRDEECRRFENLVDDGGLDLTILGLGVNGHLGLNEPGSLPDSPTRVVDITTSTATGAHRYGTVERPEQGMTLGLRPILESKEIWLLVTGPHKAGILERMLSGPVGPAVPASFLRDHRKLTVFADRSAAGTLSSGVAE